MGAAESNGQKSENQSEIGQDQIYNEDQYEYIGQTFDSRLGDIKILRHKLSERQLAVKQKYCTSKSEYEQAVGQLDTLKFISHPNILKVIDIRSEKDEGFCSQVFMIRTIYEYLQEDLQQEAIGRVDFDSDERHYYEEQEIVHLLQDIISALLYLKEQKVYHGDVVTKNVLLSQDVHGNKLYKLHIPQFTTQSTHYQKVLRKEEDQLFLSPQLLEELQQQKITPEFDQEKSEVFQIGIIGLQVALLEETNSCYNFEDLAIIQETVQGKLEQIADKYSMDLAQILLQFLEIKEEYRPNLEDAQTLIQKHPYAKDMEQQINQHFENESPETQNLIKSRAIQQDQQEEHQNGFVENEEQNTTNQQLHQGEEQVEGHEAEQNSNSQEFQQQQQHLEEQHIEKPHSFQEQQQLEQENIKKKKPMPNELSATPNKSYSKQPFSQYTPQSQEKNFLSVSNNHNRQHFSNDQLNSSIKNIDQMVKEAMMRSEDTKRRYDSNQQLRNFMKDLLDDEIYIPINPSPGRKSHLKSQLNKSSRYYTKPFRGDGWKI